MITTIPPSKTVQLLALLAIAVIAWSGWAPTNRIDWLMENGLVIVALPLLAWGYRRLPLSPLSYLCLFIFLCLHEVGAHYTYSLVPYLKAPASAQGLWPGSEHLVRNNYDRLVHFAYGLLVTPAAIDLFRQRAPASGPWRWILPVTFVMAHSVIYELLEWSAAATVGRELGQAYLGMQGDGWDAQKDMMAASAGSIITMVGWACSRWHPFSQDWPLLD